MKKSVIAITGGTRCGKDTVANIITRLIDVYEIDVFSYASILKEEVAKDLNMPVSTINEFKNLSKIKIRYKDKDLTVRDILIKKSLEIKSKYGEDYFSKKVIDKIKSSSAEVVIITDLRFEQEYTDLLNLDLNVIFIYVDSDLKDCYKDEYTDNNITRDQCDFYLFNKKGRVKDLELDVKKIVEDI